MAGEPAAGGEPDLPVARSDVEATMLSDPRRGLVLALSVMAVCALWFGAVALDEAAIRDALGMNRHAITFGGLVVSVFAGVAALVFARFAAVRDELLAGRRVLGRWRVDPITWAAVAPKALDADARDKRSALLAVLVLLFIGFGAVALIDREAAPAMMIAALGIAGAVVAAFLAGRRTQRAHWRLRDGEVIVGERGVLSNGVLHVWALPLNRLVGADIGGRPPVLTVAYAWMSRNGWQDVVVVLPVPPEAGEAAARARDGLRELATGRRP